MIIRYSKAAEKALKAMDSKTRQRIMSAVDKIPSGDIKPLTGTTFLRLRVGGYRVIFAYPEDNVAYVTKIAPRGDAYKGGSQ